jgi:hypothetical protein
MLTFKPELPRYRYSICCYLKIPSKILKKEEREKITTPKKGSQKNVDFF